MKFQIICWIFLLKSSASVPAGVYIKDGTVGASFGGYSASAGLGGSVDGSGTRGGLHAQAGTPQGHFAAAGLGGSVSEQSGPGGQVYSMAGRRPGFEAAAPAPGPAGANFQPQGPAPGPNYGGPPRPNQQQGSSIIDDIFNIPIATLGAVNQYLNNRKPGVSNSNVSPAAGQSKYNDIFNIPISALNSVNRFLKGKRK